MYSFDLRLLTISSVIYASIVCIIILLLDIKNEGESHRKLKYKLVLYYVTHILTNICFLLYFYNAELLILFNWLFMFSLVSIPIMSYAFIFEITTTSATERFSKYHYFAPIMLSTMMLILSLITPLEDQLNTLHGNGAYAGGSIPFYIFSRNLAFRFVFTITYIILSYKRLKHYRNYISSYSSNESKASLRWVYTVLIFIISLLILPVYGLFSSRTELASSFAAYLQASILTFQLSYMTYHVVKKYYILQENNSISEIENSNHKTSETLTKEYNDINILNRTDFDRYMNSQKPYLGANLKITDIAEDLNIKRNTLSNFINTEYEVNFSNFINNLRLIEYYQLRANPNYNHKSNTELAEKAGFGSYRSCTRFIANVKK